jgi:HSP20 family molecular chaperone IbpA
MKNDPQNIFEQMDAMMSRLFRDLDTCVQPGQPQTFGYRVVIHGDNRPLELPDSPVYQSRDPNEPSAEVHRIGDDVKVVVEMPGVSEENLNIRLDGQEIVIDATGSIRTYHTHTGVPPVDPASLQHTLKNGVLEVTLRVLLGSPGQEPCGEV